jgi:hypothetical protein
MRGLEMATRAGVQHGVRSDLFGPLRSDREPAIRAEVQKPIDVSSRRRFAPLSLRDGRPIDPSPGCRPLVVDGDPLADSTSSG